MEQRKTPKNPIFRNRGNTIFDTSLRSYITWFLTYKDNSVFKYFGSSVYIMENDYLLSDTAVQIIISKGIQDNKACSHIKTC